MAKGSGDLVPAGMRKGAGGNSSASQPPRKLARFGIGCMVLLAFLFVVGYWKTSSMRSQLQRRLDGFVGQGYRLQRGERVVLNEPAHEKVLLNGDRVVIAADCPFGVVILANHAEINVPITGGVQFYGGELQVGPQGEIASLDGQADALLLHGKIRDNRLKLPKR